MSLFVGPFFQDTERFGSPNDNTGMDSFLNSFKSLRNLDNTKDTSVFNKSTEKSSTLFYNMKPFGETPSNSECSSIYVGGLPSSFTETQVASIFTSFGPIQRLIVKDRFAYVEYIDSLSASNACGMDGYLIGNTRLTVRLSADNFSLNDILAPEQDPIRNYQSYQPTNSYFNDVKNPDYGVYLTPNPSTTGTIYSSQLESCLNQNQYQNQNQNQNQNQSSGRAYAIQGFTRPSPVSVFVGGTPLDVTDTELFALFSNFGHIQRINVKRNFAFVEFSSCVSAQAAISMDGYILRGKVLGVRINTPESKALHAKFLRSLPDNYPLQASRPPQPFPSLMQSNRENGVIIEGLPLDTTVENVTKLFSRFGSIRGLIVDGGVAHVDYVSSASAQWACVCMDQYQMNESGGPLKVRRMDSPSNNTEHVNSNDNTLTTSHPPPPIAVGLDWNTPTNNTTSVQKPILSQKFNSIIAPSLNSNEEQETLQSPDIFDLWRLLNIPNNGSQVDD